MPLRLSKTASRIAPGIAARTACRIALALAAAAVLAAPAAAIVGGGAADPGLARSLVMVLAEGGAACSGVVVAPQTVLTAGHCVPKGRQIRVYAPTPEASSGAPHLVPLTASAVHPGYASNAVGTRRRSVDLALIRLAEPLPPSYAPAVLAAGQAPGAGETLMVAGDGLSREGAPTSSGKPLAATLSVVEPYGRGTILIWGSPAGTGAAGACEGDSGGAMFGGAGALIAVIAFAEGAGGSRCGKLTQGVLVAPQRAFIDATLARWGVAARWTER